MCGEEGGGFDRGAVAILGRRIRDDPAHNVMQHAVYGIIMNVLTTVKRREKISLQRPQDNRWGTRPKDPATRGGPAASEIQQCDARPDQVLSHR